VFADERSSKILRNWHCSCIST